MRVSGRTLQTAAAVLSGIALTVYLLHREGDPGVVLQEMLRAVSQAHRGHLAVALALFLTSQVFRAWRWVLLSWEQPLPLFTALPLNAVHVGLGHLLPLRLADPALIGLFRRYGNLSLGRGTATVILAKLLDLGAMGVLMASAVVVGLSGSATLAAVLVGVGSLLAVFFLPHGFALLRGPLQRFFPDRLSQGMARMEQAVRVGRGRRGRFAGAFLLSLLAWSVKLFMFVYLLRAVSVDFRPIWKVLVAAAVTDMTLALPVHGLFGLGTLEAGWTAGFAAVGVTGELAPGLGVIQAGFTLHLLWLLQAVLLMVVGVLLLLLRRDKRDGG